MLVPQEEVMRDGIIQEWTVEEVLELIDERARYLLGISGEEFMRRHREGSLKNAPAEEPITVLADLVQPPAHS
jgi:hypothetical protein